MCEPRGSVEYLSADHKERRDDRMMVYIMHVERGTDRS